MALNSLGCLLQAGPHVNEYWQYYITALKGRDYRGCATYSAFPLHNAADLSDPCLKSSRCSHGVRMANPDFCNTGCICTDGEVVGRQCRFPARHTRWGWRGTGAPHSTSQQKEKASRVLYEFMWVWEGSGWRVEHKGQKLCWKGAFWQKREVVQKGLFSTSWKNVAIYIQNQSLDHRKCSHKGLRYCRQQY